METSPPDGAPPFSPLAGVVATFMPRLSEFAFEPGLVAAIDQHAAEICDLLDTDGTLPVNRADFANATVQIPNQRNLDRADLTDYVLGFNDALAESQWREPAGYDYATLRLTAVCWLIREKDLLGA